MTNRTDEIVDEIRTKQQAFFDRNEAVVIETAEAVKDLRNRIEGFEARASSPGPFTQTRETNEHKSRFIDWLRSPHDSSKKNALSEFEEKPSPLVPTPAAALRFQRKSFARSNGWN
jgi:ribosomal protein S17E